MTTLLISLAAFVGVAALVGSAALMFRGGGENKMASLWIPVVGPFLQMAKEDSATGRVLLFGLGAAQTTGAILLYYGLTTKKRVLVRNDIVGSLMVTPTAGDGTAGMLLSGRF